MQGYNYRHDREDAGWGDLRGSKQAKRSTTPFDVSGFAACQELLRDHASLRTLEAFSKVDLAVLLLSFGHNDAECCRTMLERTLFEVNQLNPHRPPGDVDRYDSRVDSPLRISFQSTQLSSVHWRRARSGMIKSLRCFDLPAHDDQGYPPSRMDLPLARDAESRTASEEVPNLVTAPLGPDLDSAPMSKRQRRRAAQKERAECLDEMDTSVEEQRMVSITARPENASWSFEELRAWNDWNKLAIAVRQQLTALLGVKDADLQMRAPPPLQVQQPYISIPLAQLMCILPTPNREQLAPPPAPSNIARLRALAPPTMSIAEFLNACQQGKLDMREAQVDEHRHPSTGGKKACYVPL